LPHAISRFPEYPFTGVAVKAETLHAFMNTLWLETYEVF